MTTGTYGWSNTPVLNLPSLCTSEWCLFLREYPRFGDLRYSRIRDVCFWIKLISLFRGFCPPPPIPLSSLRFLMEFEFLFEISWIFPLNILGKEIDFRNILWGLPILLGKSYILLKYFLGNGCLQYKFVKFLGNTVSFLEKNISILWEICCSTPKKNQKRSHQI